MWLVYIVTSNAIPGYSGYCIYYYYYWLHAFSFPCRELPVSFSVMVCGNMFLFPGWYIVWKVFLSRFKFIRELLGTAECDNVTSRESSTGQTKSRTRRLRLDWRSLLSALTRPLACHVCVCVQCSADQGWADNYFELCVCAWCLCTLLLCLYHSVWNQKM